MPEAPPVAQPFPETLGTQSLWASYYITYPVAHEMWIPTTVKTQIDDSVDKLLVRNLCNLLPAKF